MHRVNARGMKLITLSFFHRALRTQGCAAISSSRAGSPKERTRSGIPESFDRQAISPVSVPERTVEVEERITDSVSVTSKSSRTCQLSGGAQTRALSAHISLLECFIPDRRQGRGEEMRAVALDAPAGPVGPIPETALEPSLGRSRVSAIRMVPERIDVPCSTCKIRECF